MSEARTCVKCAKDWPVAEFYGTGHVCRECRLRYNREYSKKHRAKAREYQRAYNKGKRRATEKARRLREKMGAPQGGHEKGITSEQMAARKQCGRCYSIGQLADAHGSRFVRMINEITSGIAVYAGGGR